MKRGVFVVAALALALALAACGKSAPPPPAERAAEPPRARPPTTSWAIAGENLDAEIAARLAKDDPAPRARLSLVELLLTRGQFLARIADYEKAAEIAEAAARTSPRAWEAQLSSALADGALHRFAEATRALDRAEALGGDARRIASARASLLAATGRYEEAAALARDRTTRAVLAARMQRMDEATRLFDEARETDLPDVAPYPLAWLDFQRAAALEAAGREKQARTWYAEALDVIPVYAHAATHLAAYEPPDRALARLAPLEKTSDDPDVLASLADAHRRAGHADVAQAYEDAARARFEALLAAHPEAFGDHAARFFLRTGDAARALALAEDAARLRPTEEAVDLWMGAAAAAGSREAVCAAAARMTALPHASAERRRLAAAAAERCPR